MPQIATITSRGTPKLCSIESSRPRSSPIRLMPPAMRGCAPSALR
jgi:hypothetical protein